ncbi:MAG: hypothetical protein GTO14_03775 [Anaerolineales bacterium]|nr:hypothetical protein [Anaerolineales bacterium]
MDLDYTWLPITVATTIIAIIDTWAWIPTAMKMAGFAASMWVQQVLITFT